MSCHDSFCMLPRKDNSNTNKSKQASLQRSSQLDSTIQRVRKNPQSFSHADSIALQRNMSNKATNRHMKENGFIKEKTKTVQNKALPEKETPLQGKIKAAQMETVRKDVGNVQMKKENKTGLPDNLKAGMENMSRLSLDDVKVHYNSNKPAQVGALAYTQGTNIHIASGQEKHLPHEAWHVVQQAQGRVKPTFQLKGMAVNNDVGLEREADEMGNKVLVENEGNKRGTSLSKRPKLWNHEKMNNNLVQMMKATATRGDSSESFEGKSGDDYSDIEKNIANKFSEILPAHHTEREIFDDATRSLPEEKKKKFEEEFSNKYKEGNQIRPRTQCAEPHALIGLLAKTSNPIPPNTSIKISNIHDDDGEHKPCLTCRDWVDGDDKEGEHSIQVGKLGGLIALANEKIKRRLENKAKSEVRKKLRTVDSEGYTKVVWEQEVRKLAQEQVQDQIQATSALAASPAAPSTSVASPPAASTLAASTLAASTPAAPTPAAPTPSASTSTSANDAEKKRIKRQRHKQKEKEKEKKAAEAKQVAERDAVAVPAAKVATSVASWASPFNWLKKKIFS